MICSYSSAVELWSSGTIAETTVTLFSLMTLCFRLNIKVGVKGLLYARKILCLCAFDLILRQKYARFCLILQSKVNGLLHTKNIIMPFRFDLILSQNYACKRKLIFYDFKTHEIILRNDFMLF